LDKVRQWMILYEYEHEYPKTTMMSIFKTWIGEEE